MNGDTVPPPDPRAHALAVPMWTALLLIAAGVSYSSWVLSYWLSPAADVRDGYLSELSAAEKPNHLFFVGADSATGVLVLAALAVTARRGHRSGTAATRPWSARLVIICSGLFAIATLADAALPLNCSPYRDTTCALLERSNHLPVSHQLHSVTSAVAVAAALTGMVTLAVAEPWTGRS